MSKLHGMFSSWLRTWGILGAGLRESEFFSRHSLASRWQISAVALLAAVLAGFQAPVAFGQAVNGNVLGTITDSTGAAVSGAKVTITEQDQSVSSSAATNDTGF